MTVLGITFCCMIEQANAKYNVFHETIKLSFHSLLARQFCCVFQSYSFFYT